MAASRSSTAKSDQALRNIREVADTLGLPQHVLRFWESKFPQIQPLKRQGGRRFYRPQDIELLQTIQALLYEKGYTIKGAIALLGKSPARVAREETAEARASKKSAAPETVGKKSDDKKKVLRQIRSELAAAQELLKKAG